MTTQRILVVDDDPSIVRALRSYLEQANLSVLTAYDGSTAMRLLENEQPELLILDLMLPDRDGWNITRAIRSSPTLATTPIIMLTARVDDTDKIIGLELGADDYITKPFNAREVTARVRSLLRRSQFGNGPTASIIQSGNLRLDIDRHEFYVSGQLTELTPTEFNLMQIFMMSPGHTFTREELLEKVLGYAYEGMSRTLDTHIKNLRYKIEPDPKDPSYIQTVYSIGYRLATI
ncbi:MAG: response regulator transcription factor [Chloroflexota bacterium]